MTVEQVERGTSIADRRVGDRGELPVLWHLKVSHYNEKVRWALDHKRIPHVRRAAMPGLHRGKARRLGGGRTFPVLVLDGEAFGDSTQIIAALEERHPEHPLYPDDPGDRRRALALEDHFDEELGPHLRVLAINSMLPSADVTIGAFFPDLAAYRRLASLAMFPLIRRRFVREIAITEESVELAWTRVRAAADRFAAELKPSGYLVGDRFGVADLTLAALLAPALAPEQFPYPQPQRGHPLFHELRAALAEHGLADWAREIYARHRGVSAEVRSPRR